MNFVRRYGGILALLTGLLFLAWQYLSFIRAPYFSDPQGTIVFIMTDEEPQVYADQVYKGLTKARDAADTEWKPSLETLRLPIQEFQVDSRQALSPGVEFRIRRRIMERLGRGGVLALVSAGSSTVDQVVSEVAATLRVPLIITAATHTEIIPPRDTTSVVRLIGSNHLQADAIAKWIVQHERTALIYQPSQYANNLTTLIATRVHRSGKLFLSFPITNPNDYLSFSELATIYKFTAFVVVAYPPELYDLTSATFFLSPDAPVLVSDSGAGAFYPASNDAPRLFICYPVPPADARSLPPGFEPLGFDSYILLSNLHDNHSRLPFVDRLNQIILQEADELHIKTDFTPQGERESAPFDIAPSARSDNNEH